MERGNNDIQCKFVLRSWEWLCKECFDQIKQILPVEDEQRNQRPELNQYAEREKHFVIWVQTHVMLSHQQMGGRRDRDEFSQSLDDAEEEGMEYVHCE